MKQVKTVAIVLIFCVVIILIWFPQEQKGTLSLYCHIPFYGHPWYNAPMKGYTVQFYNGSVFTVHSDYWDSCEHNPNQTHLIGVGFTNKTAYDERVKLDMNFSTRNYTATHETIVWVDASNVEWVK